MDQPIQVLLFNVCFIVTLLMCFQIWKERRRPSEQRETHAVTLLAALGAMLSMSFPIPLGGVYMDLRLLPLILGIWYGGRSTAVTVFGVIVLYRLLYGGGQIGLTILTIGTLTLVTDWTTRYFHRWSIRKKVLLGSCFGAGAAVYVVLVIVLVRGIAMPIGTIWISILLTHVLGMLLLIGAIETMKQTAYLRREIVKAEKLEIVSHLAASISHEIRNPLTATRGFLQLLRDTDLPQERREAFFDIAISELDRAEGIIRDYLTFAKPAAPMQMRLDVQRELNYVLEIIQPLAVMHNVTVAAQLQPCYIMGQQQPFQQCLLNMMKNAIEAMREGGQLSVSIQAAAGQVEIEIADTGCGMTKEQLSHLGEPYFSTKGSQGTGLGMMVVYSIVKAMNGHIHAESEWGKGSTFYLCFPAVALPAQDAAHANAVKLQA